MHPNPTLPPSPYTNTKWAGPYTCDGKNLAMMELRRVTAELLTKYDIGLVPGQSAEAFLGGGMGFFYVVDVAAWVGVYAEVDYFLCRWVQVG